MTQSNASSKLRQQLLNEAYKARAMEHQRAAQRLTRVASARSNVAPLVQPPEVTNHKWDKPEWWMYADIVLDLELLMQVCICDFETFET